MPTSRYPWEPFSRQSHSLFIIFGRTFCARVPQTYLSYMPKDMQGMQTRLICFREINTIWTEWWINTCMIACWINNAIERKSGFIWFSSELNEQLYESDMDDEQKWIGQMRSACVHRWRFRYFPFILPCTVEIFAYSSVCFLNFHLSTGFWCHRIKQKIGKFSHRKGAKVVVKYIQFTFFSIHFRNIFFSPLILRCKIHATNIFHIRIESIYFCIVRYKRSRGIII